MEHKIKIDVNFADAVCLGDKNFEVRYNDRGYQKGDIIIFQAVALGTSIKHQINNKKYIITYVLTGMGMYVVFGIKETE